MSGGELDLDAIEARAERFGQPGQSDESMDLAAHYLARQVRPLVAEVRRLRALVDHLVNSPRGRNSAGPRKRGPNTAGPP